MSDGIKENDIVKKINFTGTECVARVRWVNEKGEAGVTFISPDSYKGAAQVVTVDELEVVQSNIKEDLKDVSITDLKAAIMRLRGMRAPKKLSIRKPSKRKQSTKSKLDALLAEGGDVLDGLLTKAIKEIKEEGGDKQDGD